MKGSWIAGVVALAVLGCGRGDKGAGHGATLASLTPEATNREAKIREELCSWKTEPENGHPQGRLIRMGCLEMLEYFYAVDDEGREIVPPARLPGIVKTAPLKYKTKEYTLKLESDSSDTCIKAHKPQASVIDAVPLYKVTVAGTSVDLCADEDLGEPDDRCTADELDRLKGRAIAVPGYWDVNGFYQEKESGKRVFTLACASGLAAKCVHWGYPPWASYPPGSENTLAEHFKACVAAARAAYVEETPRSYTCAGTKIDMFDNLGIQVRDETSQEGFSFESAWSGGRPVCIDRTRFQRCEREKITMTPCSNETRSDDQWPAGVLIKVWSSGQNRTNGNVCPSTAGNCL